MAFQFTITEHIATLSKSGNVTKELNRVEYNGYPAKLDLRSWREDETGKHPLKGLTLTNEEAAALYEALETEV